MISSFIKQLHYFKGTLVSCNGNWFHQREKGISLNNFKTVSKDINSGLYVLLSKYHFILVLKVVVKNTAVVKLTKNNSFNIGGIQLLRYHKMNGHLDSPSPLCSYLLDFGKPLPPANVQNFTSAPTHHLQKQ